MERLGSPAGAAPTTAEKKWSGTGAGGAEATGLERQYQPGAAPAPAKKNTVMIAAIAAVVVIAIAIGLYFAMGRKEPTPVATTTAAPSTTEVTTTAPTREPIPAGQGLLLLSASPYADLEKIVSKADQAEIPLIEDYRSTPAAIPLKPGDYLVTMSGPNGKQQTIEVAIKAGERKRAAVDMGGVDYEALAKEVNKP
jgi:hypothetical protein